MDDENSSTTTPNTRSLDIFDDFDLLSLSSHQTQIFAHLPRNSVARSISGFGINVPTPSVPDEPSVMEFINFLPYAAAAAQ